MNTGTDDRMYAEVRRMCGCVRACEVVSLSLGLRVLIARASLCERWSRVTPATHSDV